MTTYPFVFIHGAGGSKSKWRKLTSLGDEHTYLDLPGHGQNKTAQCDTIEQYALTLSKDITHDCIAVGHSMGGLISLELACRNPHIKGVVLVNSSYELPVHPSVLSILAEGSLPEALFRASYAKAVDPALLEEERAEMQQTPNQVLEKDFLACDRYRAGEEALQSLHIPILTLLGDEDHLVPPSTPEKLKQVNHRVNVVIIEGAGHYVALEKPEAVLEELKAFQKLA